MIQPPESPNHAMARDQSFVAANNRLGSELNRPQQAILFFADRLVTES